MDLRQEAHVVASSRVLDLQTQLVVLSSRLTRAQPQFYRDKALL